MFAPFGEITEVKLVLRPDGLFRGAATVAFATAAEGYAASQALASYVPHHNRPIVIAEPTEGELAPKLMLGPNSAYAPAAGSYAGAACGACGGAPPTSSAPPTAAPGAATTAPPPHDIGPTSGGGAHRLRARPRRPHQYRAGRAGEKCATRPPR